MMKREIDEEKEAGMDAAGDEDEDESKKMGEGENRA
jgi:hypothetical protein